MQSIESGEEVEKPAPLPRNVWVLGWVSLWNDIASEMVYPLLPSFLLSMFGGNRFYLGIIEGTAESLASLMKLWSGARSDRGGRRKPYLVFGYTLTALTRPFTSVLYAPWQLLLLRLSDRFGKGVRAAPRDALVVDSTSPDQRGRAFGFQRSMDHLGAAIGPALATGFLLLYPGQLRTLFALTIIPGFVVVCLVWFGVREAARAPEEARREPEDSSGESLVEREVKVAFPNRFWVYMLAVVIFTLGNSSDAFLLVRASDLGVPIAWLPMLWCVFHLLKSAGSVVAGMGIDRFGAKRLLFVGWFVYAATYIGFALATQAWHVYLLFALYSIFYSLAEPAERALVAELVGKERRGLAYGWFNASIGIAALPASLLFGWLFEAYGAMTAFGAGAACAVLASLTLAFVKPLKPATSIAI